MKSVSIIIPVYNASLYLERCLLSLFKQSLQEIEYLFVDDCSTDDSVFIIQNVISKSLIKSDSVKIIRHTKNKGSAAARNTGLENATGEYVGWVDADDFTDVNMFEKLFYKAKLLNADMVWCNYVNVLSDGESNNIKQLIEEDSYQFRKALLLNQTESAIWNKLMRRSVFEENKIRFLEGQDMGEDFNVLFKFLHFANKIAYVPGYLYYYCHDNPKSISKEFNTDRVYQIIANTRDILSFITRFNKDIFCADILDKFKFYSKRKLLSSVEIKDLKYWKNIFPDSNYLAAAGLLSRNHVVLAKIIILEQWFFVRLWVFLKVIRHRFI